MNIFETEKQVCDWITREDSYIDYYSHSGGITFNNIKTLLKFREKFPIAQFHFPIGITKLSWDNWRHRPSIINKKSSKNLLFIEYHNSATSELFAMSFFNKKRGGISVIKDAPKGLIMGGNEISDSPTVRVATDFLLYKNNRAEVMPSVCHNLFFRIEGYKWTNIYSDFDIEYYLQCYPKINCFDEFFQIFRQKIVDSFYGSYWSGYEENIFDYFKDIFLKTREKNKLIQITNFNNSTT